MGELDSEDDGGDAENDGESDLKDGKVGESGGPE